MSYFKIFTSVLVDATIWIGLLFMINHISGLRLSARHLIVAYLIFATVGGMADNFYTSVLEGRIYFQTRTPLFSVTWGFAVEFGYFACLLLQRRGMPLWTQVVLAWILATSAEFCLGTWKWWRGNLNWNYS